MYQFDFKKRVRYSETDKMGYLYYGQYPKYYEIGRVEMLRSLGMSYREMEDELGVMMPVASLEIRYLRPAYYDELITIRTKLLKLPDKRIRFYVELYNEEGLLINSGKVSLAFVELATGKTVQAPPKLLEVLQPHFEDTEDHGHESTV